MLMSFESSEGMGRATPKTLSNMKVEGTSYSERYTVL